jgi:hypothetical protein
MTGVNKDILKSVLLTVILNCVPDVSFRLFNNAHKALRYNPALSQVTIKPVRCALNCLSATPALCELLRLAVSEVPP